MSARIKDNLDIFNLLKNIEKSKQLISLSFDALPQHCLTSLLEVHYDSKILRFDEPNPELNTKFIEKKEKAFFSLKLEHLPVKFKSTIVTTNSKNKNNDFYTLFPDEIYYPQNRNYYRLSTEFNEKINITIFLSSTNRIPCHLINISLIGLCLRFPYALASIFQPNKVINDIYIELPNQKGFSISAKIQNTRVKNNYANIDVGLQIQHHKPAIEKSIQQFIFRSENI